MPGRGRVGFGLGPGATFGLTMIMLEGRHPAWEGAGVSSFWRGGRGGRRVIGGGVRRSYGLAVMLRVNWVQLFYRLSGLN